MWAHTTQNMLCMEPMIHKFLIAGDFNVQVGEPLIDNFLDDFGATNLVKEFMCFKSTNNPSCIDLFLTNSGNNFQNTQTVNTGISDFHAMIATVLKTTFPKVKRKTTQNSSNMNFELN